METSRHHCRYPPANLGNLFFTKFYSLLQTLVKIASIIHMLSRITNLTHAVGIWIFAKQFFVHTNKAQCKSSQTHLLEN